MKEKNVISTEEQLQLYEQFLHEKNRKRVQWGIRVLLFGPLIFVALMMLMDSNKNIYLLLWIISLFGLSTYLISVEYMDHQMQSHLRKLGVNSLPQVDPHLVEIGVESEEDALLADEVESMENQDEPFEEQEVSFSPLKQLKNDWKAVILEEKEEEVRIQEMSRQTREALQEDTRVNLEDYDFDPFEEEEDESETFGGEEVVSADEAMTGNDAVTGQSAMTGNDAVTGQSAMTGNDAVTGQSFRTGNDAIQSIDDQIKELVRKKMELQIRAQVEAEIRAKIESELEERVQKEVSKTLNQYISEEASKIFDPQDEAGMKEGN